VNRKRKERKFQIWGKRHRMRERSVLGFDLEKKIKKNGKSCLFEFGIS